MRMTFHLIEAFFFFFKILLFFHVHFLSSFCNISIRFLILFIVNSICFCNSYRRSFSLFSLPFHNFVFHFYISSLSFLFFSFSVLMFKTKEISNLSNENSAIIQFLEEVNEEVYNDEVEILRSETEAERRDRKI